MPQTFNMENALEEEIIEQIHAFVKEISNINKIFTIRKVEVKDKQYVPTKGFRVNFHEELKDKDKFMRHKYLVIEEFA